MEPSVDLVLETGEQILKAQRSSGNLFGVFVLADIFQEFKSLLPEYAKVVKVLHKPICSLTNKGKLLHTKKRSQNRRKRTTSFPNLYSRYILSLSLSLSL